MAISRGLPGTLRFLIHCRTFMFFATLTALLLAGCYRDAGWRYKLSLAVDTPDGIKTGSSVVDIRLHEVTGVLSGLGQSSEGEAVYVDLGPGKRPLIALLTRNHRLERPEYRSWDHGGPMTDFLLGLYGEQPSIGDYFDNVFDNVAHLTLLSRPREIPPAALPDLVTFAEIDDPTTWLWVDPGNLRSTLGPGVKWRSITLEVTDEPVTIGIETKLPWLRGSSGKLWKPRGPGGGLLSRHDFETRHNGVHGFDQEEGAHQH